MRVPFFLLCISFLYGVHGNRVKRIIGGQSLDFREYGYQVSLWQDGQLSCSGVILDDKHILIAAHCADGISADRLKIAAGVSYIGQKSRLNFLDVRKVQLHPGFPGSHIACDDIENDIGVLTLKKSLHIRLWQNSLNFPSSNIIIDSIGRLAGWGLTSFPNGATSPNLVQINLKVLSPTECNLEGMQVKDSQFCAVHPTKQKTACMGDSGAPFVFENELHGILSITCCDPDTPVIFESVFVHADFIRRAMLD